MTSFPKCFLFALLLGSFCSELAYSTTYTAASCNASDVQTAMNSATHTGDIVSIPAGTCGWTVQVKWNAPANSVLMGAGSQTTPGGGNVTVITDNYAGGNNPLLLVNVATSASFRMAAITFQGGSAGTGNDKYDGIVSIQGTSLSVRVDHSHFNTATYSPTLNSSGLEFQGCIGGVTDDSIFDNPTGSVNNGVRLYNDGTCNNDGLGVGDQSWTIATSLGSSNFMFVETNTFNSGAGNDCTKGGRYVWRYNTMNNTGSPPAVQTHPTGGGERERGCRAWEIYHNTFNAVSGNYVNAAFWLSSGTGVIWGNALPSSSAGGGTGYRSLISGHEMRYDNSTYAQSATPAGWGYCGTHETGTASAWDQNADSTGHRCIDQPGAGVGQLLVNDFPNAINNSTGTVTWPNQASEPIYEWADAYSPVPSNPSGIWTEAESGVVNQNRDYYLGTTNSGTPISFNGTSGVGAGLLAARPSTCTAMVAYWATDTNTLYQCASTNTWSAYYTPYTYPHPLTQSGTCTISPGSIGPYTAGQSVSQIFTTTSCSSSNFMISSGSLTGSGLSLNSSTGVLSGTAAAGSFSFTVAYGTASEPISLTVNTQPSITTTTLPNAPAGSSYSQTLAMSGGTAPNTCGLTSGSLSGSGLGLNSNCTITGTAAAVGTYSFAVMPTDSNGMSGSSRALSLSVAANCIVSPGSLGPYTAGQSVSQTFTEANCSSSTFTITSGSLTGSGLSLNSSTGILSGTAVAGSFSFTVAYGTASDAVSLNINAKPSITTTTLSSVATGSSYAQTLATSGGTAPITCALTSGSLSGSGVSLNSNCTVTGTAATVGTYSFTATPTDSDGVSGIGQPLSLNVTAVTAGTPTLVQHVASGMDQNPVAALKITLPNPAGAGNALILGVQFNSSGAISSVADNGGNTWVAGPTVTDASAGHTMRLYYALGVAGGTQTITVTFSGLGSISGFPQAVISEFYNVTQVSAADGSSGSASSRTAGAITTTAPGDLIYHWGVDFTDTNANGGAYNGSSITAGAGFTLLSADLQVGSADQYEVQSSAGSVNPTFTASGSATWGSLALALKSASAGTPPPSGIRIVHIQHTLLAEGKYQLRSTPVVMQFPSSGNLLVGLFNSPDYFITNVSDSAKNSWVSAGSTTGGGGNTLAQTVYAANASTSPTLSGITVTVGASTGGGIMFDLYDITGAGTSPFDKATTAQGNQTSSGNLTTASLTPSTANGLVLNNTAIDFHTINGIVGSGYVLDCDVDSLDNDAAGTNGTLNSNLDEDNGFAHIYNATTSPVTFVYTATTTGTPAGVLTWGSVSTSFIAASGGGQGTNPPATVLATVH